MKISFEVGLGKLLLWMSGIYIFLLMVRPFSSIAPYEGFGSALDYKMGKGVTLQDGGKGYELRNFSGRRNRGETAQFYQLPPTKMAVFDDVRFAPECCPSRFSNSSGCACAPANLEKYIAEQRGGNNTKGGGSF